MGSIVLVAGLIVTWILFRSLAGRATLKLSILGLVFALGAASSVIGIVLERLAYLFFEVGTVGRLVAAPIDEICKALPLLVLVARSQMLRRLTISDFALLGLAAGLGYEFISWDFATLSGLAPQAWLWPVFGSLFVASEWEHAPAYFSGAATTAFVGLVAGVCVRLHCSRRKVEVAALLALFFVILENGMYRWQVGPLLWSGVPEHLAPTSVVARVFYGVMLDGRLSLFLLVIGLLIDNWLEARWVRLTAPEAVEDFLLDDDGITALVSIEMLVALQRLLVGWRVFTAIHGYFRDRRAYALIAAEARRSPDAVLSSWALPLKRTLSARYSAINTASPVGKIRRPGVAMPSYLGASNRPRVFAAILFIVYLMVPPTAWGGLKSVVFGDWTALVLIVASIGFLVLRRFGAGTAVGKEETESTLESELDPTIVLAAIALSVVAVVTWFLPLSALAPHYGAARFTPLEPFEIWSTGPGYPVYGGNPHTYFAVVAAIFACLPSPSASARRVPVSDSEPLSAGISEGA